MATTSPMSSPDLYPTAEPLSRPTTPFNLASSNNNNAVASSSSPRKSRDVDSIHRTRRHTQNIHSGPPSRSGTPSNVLNLPEAIDDGSDGNGSHAGGHDDHDDAHQKASSESGQPQVDYVALLPKKADLEDAQSAIAKLDRIQTAKETKRWWMKVSGVSVLDDSKRRKKKARKRNGSIHEMSTLASTSNVDLGGDDDLEAPQEVHLGITSIPGYSVLAVKKAAHKTRGVASKAKGLAVRSTSPGHDEDDGEEGAAEVGGSLRDRKSPPPARRGSRRESFGQRRESLGHRLASVKHRPTHSLDGQAMTAMMGGGPSATEATTQAEEEDAGLGAVQEDRHLEEKETGNETVIVKPPNEEAEAAKPARVRPRVKIPTFHLQEPSSQNIAPDGDASPAVKPVATRGALSLGSPDEADDHSHLVASPTALSPIRRWPSSSSSSSAGEVGDDSATTMTREPRSGSSDEDDTQLACLSLEHGQSLTNKELRKQLKRDKALPKDSLGRATNLSHKVSRGLHYATSESRNRRAMEKFSPANPPQRSATGAAGGPRRASLVAEDASLSRVNSLASRQGGFEGGWNPAFTMSRSSRGTPNATTPDESDMGAGEMFRTGSPLDDQLKRTTTLQSTASSTADSHLLAPRPWHFRQRHRWAKAHADESVLADESAAPSPAIEHDAEQELNDVLTKLAAEQAPEQAGEKFEWDVLYENQRGMLFFGMPKFSARTLLQWDPAPWTDYRFQNSPYSIVNAQLPDPAWQWVYPEWVIDMAGDVDEQGWQYSGNFGRNPFAALSRVAWAKPQPTTAGKEADMDTSERLCAREDERRKRERSREDEGLEALKRSIKARGSKWTGRPDPGSFVRRRRWIRLRKRPALEALTSAGQGQSKSKPQTPALTIGLHDDGLQADDSSIESSSSDDSSDSEMDEEGSESSGSERASPYAKASGFLPRRTAGHLRNGPDPLRPRKSVRRATRHDRKAFTGTLREFKNLLPAVLGCADATTAVIDARNPFLSWQYIKRRLNDDDMSWKVTSLRQRERRNQQRRIPSAWGAERRPSEVGPADRLLSEVAGPPAPSWDLTRDALVEVNFVRVKRVMRACKADRQRLDLWRCWLGGTGGGESRPDPNDVWDVLERRLDAVLYLFEFNSSRATLLQLLLSVHDASHPQHRYRSVDGKLQDEEGHLVKMHAPKELDPRWQGDHDHDHAGAREMDWIVGLTSRLQFFSDVRAIAGALEAQRRGEQPTAKSMLAPASGMAAGSSGGSSKRNTPSPAADHSNDLGLRRSSMGSNGHASPQHSSIYWQKQVGHGVEPLTVVNPARSRSPLTRVWSSATTASTSGDDAAAVPSFGAAAVQAAGASGNGVRAAPRKERSSSTADVQKWEEDAERAQEEEEEERMMSESPTAMTFDGYEEKR